MLYRTRLQWGARFNVAPVPTIPTPVKYLFVHHNVITPTFDPNHDMLLTESTDIARFGKPSYDYGIHPSGVVLEGMTTHLSPDTYGHNRDSLSIMFMGNFEIDVPTGAALQAGRELIAMIAADGLVVIPITLLGHRDVYATACPGRNLYSRLPELLLPITPPEKVDDPVNTVVLPDGTVLISLIGLDSGIYTNERPAGGQWGGWVSIGGRARGDIDNRDIKVT